MELAEKMSHCEARVCPTVRLTRPRRRIVAAVVSLSSCRCVYNDQTELGTSVFKIGRVEDGEANFVIASEVE